MPRRAALKKEEARTYVESVTLVILFLLTILSFVTVGFGFIVPSGMLDRMLTNLLLIFAVAEGCIIVMLLYRIQQELAE